MERPTLVVVGIRTLGREIAHHFARSGWEVVCAARTEADVREVAAEVDALGGVGVPVVCDLQAPETLAALVRPRLDLVVCAQTAGGRFGPKPLLELERADLDRGLAAYVGGTWSLLQAVGPAMVARRAGTFLQIGTSSGVRTKEGYAALGATQHALKALVQCAAREWRPANVHVAYLPIDGGIASPKTEAWVARSGADRAIPQAEIARACAYLHAQDPRAWTHELVLRPTGGDWTGPT